MRFYSNQHKYYCGIDLHTQKMYVYILDAAGEVFFSLDKPVNGCSFPLLRVAVISQ